MTTKLTEHDKIGPQDAAEFPANVDTPGAEEFQADLGATKEFPQKDAIFPNIFKNLGKFDFNDIVDAEDHYDFEFDEFGQTPYGTLVEHVPTGYIFALIPNEYPAPVFNYHDEKGWPTGIELYSDQRWEKTDLDFPHTRVGGSTDFSPVAWPHFNNEPLLFAAQYVLPDGKRIHVFVDDEGDDSWAVEDGANCAIVEGGPVPSWITLKPIEDPADFLRNPDKAITPVRDSGSKVPLAPLWVQGDETPNDVGYRFLIQFGNDAGNSDGDFMFGDSGDMYLFYKEETNEARVLWQCC